MSKVEGGGGQIDTHPPLEVSCNYFFFEASRVKLLSLRKLSKPALPGPDPVFLCFFFFLVWRSVGGRGDAKMMKHIGIKLIGLIGQIWNLSYRVLQVTERQITSQFGKKTKTKTKETTGCKIINRTYKYQKYSVIARYLKVTICP